MGKRAVSTLSVRTPIRRARDLRDYEVLVGEILAMNAEGYLEEVYLKDYQDFEEAHQNIAQFIEEVYNQKRLHSSLGYLPPVDFEARHARKARS